MEIGLVLGGGGARGSAHIGVIQALEARDLTPVAIAGCSMGAIVGAFFAGEPLPVPEPGTAALMGLGLALLATRSGRGTRGT